ncbi:MAG: phospholipase D family nuclease [Candidatus Bathyarchaeia archaeon]
MKSLILVVAVFILGVASGIVLSIWLISPTGTSEARYTPYFTQATPSVSYEVCFSPGGGCKSKLIYLLGRANKTIHVMIYSFTLDDISDALVSARNRGVEVKIVFERESLNEYSEYNKLRGAGVQVRVDTNPALMHNKVAIIDSLITITGSYNWSGSAEDRNNENMIILRSAEIASIYEGEFNKIWSVSK